MKTLKTQHYIFLILSCLITINVSAQRSNFDFVENKGQWDSRVKFMGDVGTGSFFLEKQGFTVLLHNPQDLENVLHHGHSNIFDNKTVSALRTAPDNNSNSDNPDAGGKPGNGNSAVVRSHAYRVHFEGASDNIDIIPSKAQDTYNNYILGGAPAATHCKLYRTVTYKNVYPGIDVRYYSDAGALKYDIVVNPGANPNLIAMKYEGADKLTIKDKQLYIKTSVGDVKELYPYSYQFDNIKGKTEIDCKYEIINGNTVKFKLKNYSSEVPLIIDPTLIFSSFTGSTVDNWGFTATPGPDGSLYAGGIVWGSGYPLTPGAIQQAFRGDKVDMGITRFSPSGNSRIYSTYLGGSGNDFPLSMISDAQGNLVIMGRTYSTNFPGVNGASATLFGPGGSSDLIVVKLNATGTGIIGAVRVGGDGPDAVNVEDQRLGSVSPKSTLHFYGDDSRGEVILDPSNNIYVVTQTQSNNFFTRNPFQATRAGGQDGAVLKIDPNCSNIIFSSFLGGSGDDGVFVMALSPSNGNLYVAGTTVGTLTNGSMINDFPGNKTGVIQSTYDPTSDNPTDGFVTEIASDGSAIIRTTYLGTNKYDAVYGLKFDRTGYPYVMGITRSPNWPVKNATYSVSGGRQFVAKLQPDLSAYVYSTVFGSPGATAPNISPVAFLVDRCENVYISGWGGSLVATAQTDVFGQAGTQGLPTTPDAVKVNTDNKDFYFIVIKRDASQLLYGSFFGQNGGFTEHVDGGTSRFDQQGVIYQAICANCEGNSIPNAPVIGGYPTTPGAVATTNGAGDRGCNLGAVKIAFNFAGVGAGLRAYIEGVFDTTGCVPVTVLFKDTIRNAVSYEWDFGDGSPQVATTDPQIPHTYNAIGSYRVMMVAIDPASCNIRDTAYTTIRVRNDEAFLSFTYGKSAGPCESLSYDFVNTSTHTATAKPFTNQSFIWDFGDGTRVVSGLGNISHSYASPGTYKVQLILPDTNYCNSPDADTISLRVAPLVKAQFETPPAGCIPYNAVFNNTSLAGMTFKWDFGDGSTSNAVNPSHVYPTPGTYTIKLVAIDTNTCNKIDSTTFSITVSDKPTAGFTYSPTAPQQNFPYTFTNTSSTDAIRFTWTFGDGESLTTTSRAAIDHQYNTSGTFNACLRAYNTSGCMDSVCAPLQNIIVPKLDVPNAFAPLSGAPNNIVFVRGFGIGKMTWRIYNRMGNLVFESNDKLIGWDGKYKGVVQPMDVYAYTLEVEFTDGTRATRKGDITLLR